VRVGAGAWQLWRKEGWAWLLLAVLPVLVNLPALSGAFRYDPIYVVSGLTQGTWTTNGVLPGTPWIDGNAGVTTEALGHLAARDWLTGRLPWWNPFSGVGLPLAAEGQNPAFFLPFVLLLALPHGLLALRIILMALAGVFAFALLRRLRLGVTAAVTGAALFELNGIFAWIGHGPMLPVAFLPLMLLGVEAARARFSLALVLGMAWSLAAGFPETAFLDAAFAGVWAAVRFAQCPARWTFAMRAGGSAVCGVMLAAPAVWPFLEALPREFLGVHHAAMSSGLWPQNWALMLLPGILGAPMANVEALHGSDALWVRAGGYCDVVLVVLALAALRWRAREGALRMAVLAWVAITGLRAASVPLAVWAFGLVPFLRQTNVHLYMMPSWSMGFAVLAALAVQDWRDGVPPRWRLAGFAAAGALLLALVPAAPDIADLWHRLPRYTLALILGVGVPLCAASSVLVLIRLPWSARRSLVLCAVIVLDAAVLCLLPQFTGTHGRRVDAAAIRFLQDHAGLSRVWPLGPLVPNYGAMVGVAETGHNYLPVPQNWVDYSRAKLQAGPDAVNFYTGWPPDAARLTQMLPDYEAVGVRYALVPVGVAPFAAPASGALVLAYHGTAMDIWELPNAAPYWQADGCMLKSTSRDAVVAQCAHAARLRRLELAWPGWQASVNGRDSAITVDGGIFQAVALPAGESQVAFRYAPPFIVYAWACFWVGLVCVISMLGARRCFSRSAQRTAENGVPVRRSSS
jgi:hypothetical protein